MCITLIRWDTSPLSLSSHSLLQIFSKGQVWHKQCFKCSRCSRFLDSRIACDGPDNKIYCNGLLTDNNDWRVRIDVSACYKKVHGIKGYGFGQGSPALLSGSAVESVDVVPGPGRLVDTATILAEDEREGCPRCGGK